MFLTVAGTATDLHRLPFSSVPKIHTHSLDRGKDKAFVAIFCKKFSFFGRKLPFFCHFEARMRTQPDYLQSWNFALPCCNQTSEDPFQILSYKKVMIFYKKITHSYKK
jgi:hypothetical protein